ncbi:alpha/beta fold hydrolase [Streptomyces sp. Rer75]|nr:alpha/beta fold hydrolase [Streptomyces sp. Rer75]
MAAPASPFDSIEALYRESHALGQAGTAGLSLIKAAGQIRQSFTVETAAGHVTPVVRLAGGDGTRAAVVCVPAITATAGPVQYARLSQLLQGERDVLALTNPGFAEGELLPDSFETFLEAQIAALRSCVGERPYVLLGHSAGGLLGYAIAMRAEQAGLAPAAVVLIDTFHGHGHFSTDTVNGMMDALFAREHILGPDALSGVRLTAMGRYHTLIDQCTVAPIACPTLLLRAESPMPHQDSGCDGDEWRPIWPFPHTAVTTPGDHFTLMEDNAAVTTGAIERWLTDQGL